jgi:hypothetical protein
MDPSVCPVEPSGEVCVLVPFCVAVVPAPPGLECELFGVENVDRAPLGVPVEPALDPPVLDPLVLEVEPPPDAPPPVCAEAPTMPTIVSRDARTRIRCFMEPPEFEAFACVRD